jgi:hypothetical protein
MWPRRQEHPQHLVTIRLNQHRLSTLRERPQDSKKSEDIFVAWHPSVQAIPSQYTAPNRGRQQCNSDQAEHAPHTHTQDDRQELEADNTPQT